MKRNVLYFGLLVFILLFTGSNEVVHASGHQGVKQDITAIPDSIVADNDLDSRLDRLLTYVESKPVATTEKTMKWSGVSHPTDLDAYASPVKLGDFIYFVSDHNSYKYHISSNKWTRIQSPSKGVSANAVELNGKLYILTGEVYKGHLVSKPATLIQQYDPVTNKWSSFTTLKTTLRYKHIAKIPKTNKLMLIGGEKVSTSWTDAPEGLATNSVLYLDTVSKSITEATSISSFTNPKSISLSDGSMLISGDHVPSVDRYNPKTNKWTSMYADNFLTHDMSALSDDTVLITGGNRMFVLLPNQDSLIEVHIGSKINIENAIAINKDEFLLYTSDVFTNQDNLYIFNARTFSYYEVQSKPKYRNDPLFISLGANRILIYGGEGKLKAGELSLTPNASPEIGIVTHTNTKINAEPVASIVKDDLIYMGLTDIKTFSGEGYIQYTIIIPTNILGKVINERKVIYHYAGQYRDGLPSGEGMLCRAQSCFIGNYVDGEFRDGGMIDLNKNEYITDRLLVMFSYNSIFNKGEGQNPLESIIPSIKNYLE